MVSMELLRSWAKVRSCVTVSLGNFLDSSVVGCATFFSPPYANHS